MSDLNNQENFSFEDSHKNSLPISSLNRKIVYGGLCVLILVMIVYSLLSEELIVPRNKGDIYFKGYALYALDISGLFWFFHFAVQIFVNDKTDKQTNNRYFKYAYNSRIFGIAFLVLALLLSYIFYDSNGYQNFPDSKSKKDYIIFW